MYMFALCAFVEGFVLMFVCFCFSLLLIEICYLNFGELLLNLCSYVNYKCLKYGCIIGMYTYFKGIKGVWNLACRT